jgi:biopolymer transport protein ExbB/TolQ
MATQSKARKNGTKEAAKTPSRASEKGQVRSTAERSVDLPVGAVLTVGERIADLVEPFTGRSSAEKQLQSYRAELRRQVKRTERRGATARRRASAEARKTRNRVEREARKRQRTVESNIKRNRNELEQRVRKAIELLPV